jgi:hypothetical protein
MNAIIDLHHDIMSFLVFISFFIIHVLVSAFDEFNIKKYNSSVEINRNADIFLENI